MRVTFLPLTHMVTVCARVYIALLAHMLVYNHYTIANAYYAANAHAQGSDRALGSQQVNSRPRQSGYSPSQDLPRIFGLM